MNRDSSLLHTRKVGDTLSPLSRTLTQAGAAIDLTGTTVKLYGINSKTGVVKFNNITVQVESPNTSGKVSCYFAAGDVDTPGTYHVWFKVSSAGSTDTFPAEGFITMLIEDFT